MNIQYNTYIGLDVHARTISTKAVNQETGETWSTTLNGDGLDEQLACWIKNLPDAGKVCCAYESGPTGFHTARYLRDQGIGCIIMAISTIPTSTKAKQQKNDKNDAKHILGELTKIEPDFSEVWVPPQNIESARNLTRMTFEAAEDLKRAKQQVESRLLRYGWVWNEKTPSGNRCDTWTKGYRKWLEKIDLGNKLDNKLLKAAIEHVDARQQELQYLESLEHELSHTSEFEPYIDALTLIEGVSEKTAMMYASDIGDPSRFSGGRKVGALLGFIPKEHTTSEHHRLSTISKAGHSRLRRLIIEGDAAISTRRYFKKPARKGASVSPAIQRMATCINKRLKARYDDLIGNGKQACIARVAVAREKAQAMWALMRQVQLEMV